MSYTISNTVKTLPLAGLMIIFIGVSLGNIHSAFAETAMNTDIIMTIDTSESFNDEAELINNVLNVFTAAYIATDGNLEVVVLGENTICISAQSGSCTSKTAPHNPDIVTKAESKKAPVRILTAYEH